MRIDRAALERLPPSERKEAEKALKALEHAAKNDPLYLYRPHPCKACGGYENCGPEHNAPQYDFGIAKTRVQAAFAGNRFGKTTALVTKALIQHVPDDVLPAHLKPFKYVTHGMPVKGRLFAPTEDAILQITEQELRKWAPRSLLYKGNFDKAWNKQHHTLLFADGGMIECNTYRQEPETLVGAARDYIGYDEPPPRAHRNESKIRLTDRDGFEMFAMTPVNMGSEALGFIFQDIFMQQESPDITVIRATIHDNPRLTPEAIEAALSIYDEKEREARAKGDFIHFGGMVYVGGFEHVLCDPPDPEHVQGWQVIVGIDPGLKNAAMIWVGFDSDNTAWVFDEELTQEGTPKDYAEAIRAKNHKWGMLHQPLYVIDPSARNRSLVNKENVQAELARHGIPAVPGQNAVEAGVQQIRRRIANKGFHVARNLAGIREEALLYGMEEGEEFKVIKRRDHRLDAMRYACMQRPFYVAAGSSASEPRWDPVTRKVGKWRPGAVREAGPLGSLA